MSPAPPRPGQVLGTWTLDELLQATPMATIWRAHHRREGGVEHTVALKLFPHPVDPSVKRSVERAFRKAHGVVLDGIVVPAELRTLPEGLCLVRPWVHGQPLFDVVRSAPVDQQVALARQLAGRLFSTLAGLHREGLVHGQVSSANTWVTAEGTVHLTDLGASVAALRTTAAELPGSHTPTAPEVAAGWGPRPATDVLAAGALLYSALTPAASELTDRTTPWGIGAAEAPPGLALLRADVPAAFSMWLSQAQALDWARRPTAARLARAISSAERWSAPAPLPGCPLRIGQAGTLDAAVQHLLRPGPRLVLLVGPAGSGRHRLAEALARVQLRSQRPPLHVTADRGETGSLPGRVLHRLAGPDQHLARRRRLVRDVAGPLATLWPDLLPPAASDPDGGTDAGTLLDAAVAVAHRALADRPALLVIDRLEDADPLSLRWLHRWLDTEADLRAVALVDPRWQSDELRRMRDRLADRAAVLEVVLPDLTASEVGRVQRRLLRAVPDLELPPPEQGASPARATEHAHAELARWRGEDHPEPDAAATLFALVERIPTAAVRELGMDPARVLACHLAVPDRPGWLRRAHSGVEALGRRGLARRDRLADRLTQALIAAEAPWRHVATVALAGTGSGRTAAARAAVEAWNADHPATTTRWLLVVDRLPRDPEDPGYRLIRAPLARVRAEVAHTDPTAPVRSDLLRQAVRRARSPDEQAALAFLRGHAALRERGPAAALEVWLAGSDHTDAHPVQKARCAAWALQIGLDTGDTPASDRALRALRRAGEAPDLPRGPRRWLALGQAQAALAAGSPSIAVRALEAWLETTDAGRDPGAQRLLAWALHVRGDDSAAHARVRDLLDHDPHDAEARVLHGWLTLLAGDTRGALRARRWLDDLSTAGPLAPLFEVHLAAAQGEHHRLPTLLGRPAPSRRPDLWAHWMAGVLDALRALDAPGLRLARLDEARAAADTHPFAALHLALAWHHFDDGDTPAAIEAARAAGSLATQSGDDARRLRAQLLHTVLARTADHTWRERVAEATPHPCAAVRHDVGELSARLALQTGSPDMADQWVRYLSELAVEAPDHALAARATRVHRAIQAARGPTSAGPAPQATGR